MSKINLKEFWRDHNLEFKNFKSGLQWTKRHLDTNSLRRIAPDNYMVDAESLNKSYKQYVLLQDHIFNERVRRAKTMTSKRVNKDR